MADSLNIINQSFEQIKATCAQSGCLHEQALASIESTKQLLVYVFTGKYIFVRMN